VAWVESWILKIEDGRLDMGDGIWEIEDRRLEIGYGR
jgi:hypothetical protein